MSIIAPEMLSQPMTPGMPVVPEMVTNVAPPPMVSNNISSNNLLNISPVVLKDKKLSKAVQTNDVFEFMKAVEGFGKKAKWDYAQYTNGYGTKAKYPGEVIDKKEAQARLEEEMSNVMGKIQKKLKVPVTNGQLIALASLNYNTGSAANKLIKAINNGADTSTIAQQIRNLPKTGVGSNKVLDWQIKRRNAEADIFARGFEYGGIHINPANEGKFTASANRAGMGVQQFASQVLANKEDYSPLQVKRANFARNAAGWNHEGGGHTEGSIMDVSPEQMDQLRQQGYQFEILN
jgi:GH24 family phage-related lysozyme (muramidase)